MPEADVHTHPQPQDQHVMEPLEKNVKWQDPVKDPPTHTASMDALNGLHHESADCSSDSFADDVSSDAAVFDTAKLLQLQSPSSCIMATPRGIS